MGYKEVSLPAEVTIENIEALHAEVKTAISEGCKDGLCFNTSLTEIVTAPGVQLLLCVDKTLKMQGVPMRLKNANEMLNQSFRQLGFAEQFQEWIETHA